MKKLFLCTLATAALIAGCASVDGSNETSTVKSPAKEDYVTGSRLPRSDSNENYQGAKAMTGKDYQEYKNSTGATGK